MKNHHRMTGIGGKSLYGTNMHYIARASMFLKEDRWSMNIYLEFGSVHSKGDTTNIVYCTLVME